MNDSDKKNDDTLAQYIESVQEWFLKEHWISIQWDLTNKQLKKVLSADEYIHYLTHRNYERYYEKVLQSDEWKALCVYMNELVWREWNVLVEKMFTWEMDDVMTIYDRVHWLLRMSKYPTLSIQDKALVHLHERLWSVPVYDLLDFYSAVLHYLPIRNF